MSLSPTSTNPFLASEMITAIEALEPFVVTQPNGTRSIDVPAEVKSSIPEPIYSVLNTSVAEANKLIEAEGATTEAFGGTSRAERHWWGIKIYLSTQDANIAKGGGTAAALLFAALGGIPGKFIGTLLGVATGVLVACTGDNGIIIYVTWAQVVWCTRQ